MCAGAPAAVLQQRRTGRRQPEWYARNPQEHPGDLASVVRGCEAALRASDQAVGDPLEEEGLRRVVSLIKAKVPPALPRIASALLADREGSLQAVVVLYDL